MTNPITSYVASKWSLDHDPRPYVTRAFGILNKWGDVWTPETFGTPEAAFAHLRGHCDEKTASANYSIVPVTITVSVEVVSRTASVEVYRKPSDKIGAAA